MGYRLTELFTRARYIFQTGGLIPIIRRGFAFLAVHFFLYRTYYLYEYAVKERNEAEFMPRIRDFIFKVVASNQQADELAADGLDFRSHIINARQRLDKGAIAFCVFINSELAHISWLAVSEQAMKTFNTLPYQVDFSSNEASVLGAETNPEYLAMEPRSESMYTTGIPRLPKALITPKPLAAYPEVTMNPIELL